MVRFTRTGFVFFGNTLRSRTLRRVSKRAVPVVRVKRHSADLSACYEITFPVQLIRSLWSRLGNGF